MPPKYAGKILIKDKNIYFPRTHWISVRTKLMQYAANPCREEGISCLNILSDPNTKCFMIKLVLYTIGSHLRAYKQNCVII